MKLFSRIQPRKVQGSLQGGQNEKERHSSDTRIATHRRPRWKLIAVVGVLVYMAMRTDTSLRSAIEELEIDRSSLSVLHVSDGVTAELLHESEIIFDAQNDTHKMRRFLLTDDPIISAVTQTGEPPLTKIRKLLFDHHERHLSFRKGPTSAIGDEVLNINMDGFERSPYFEIIGTHVVPDFHDDPTFLLEEDEDVVWVVDMRRFLMHKSYSIHRQLVVLANSTLQYQDEKVRSKKLDRRPRLTVVMMDWRDRFRESTLCTEDTRELISMLGDTGSVRSVLQAVVKGRYWDDKLNFTVPGYVWDSGPDNECFGSNTLHLPYTVRSDYAEAVMQTIPKYSSPSASTAGQNAADTLRHTDIAHFWPHKPGAPPVWHSRLRDLVTDVITEMAERESLKVIVDYVSEAAVVGRTSVSLNYVEALMTTKIVVLGQRDTYEDHYRLFEALIGGGLIMTDPMLSLPEGLVDKESIVVYKSLTELTELLAYYLNPVNKAERLAIARAGWNIAVSRHRTYHWMERLFFGRQITK